ncbi:transcription regulator LrpA related protein [Thermoplasma acidophilum]|uniref:Transcription regulator LrpA related protein n=1 Tax=Thermoplasma acidophilum (strain ATCC 25905 / DSM 1728 / JCM 9062 / NBRC 15155 / AMRC-C165) TaxID=273075 RepID=Q9HJI7_THEAC|nr:Lrp/AsnC family transcriptional regulator [Thermoplasma acidophilum]CAC12110.1 transcription regulator LrpA related protein [Thermoplasma acidophilum]
MVVDQKDRDILNLLVDNARISNTEIAKVLNVSEGTVRKRIKKMMDDGIIKRFTVETSDDTIDALVLVKIDNKRYRDALQRIKSRFREVYEFTGKIDVAIRIRTDSTDNLNRIVDQIREIDGVLDTDTLIRLQ